jgi:hypothetical protein
MLKVESIPAVRSFSENETDDTEPHTEAGTTDTDGRDIVTARKNKEPEGMLECAPLNFSENAEGPCR